MNELDEIVHEFLVESQENLDRLDREFVELEESPDDREILSSIFRTIHTIKGTAGFLGYTQLGELTHMGETLLGRLREGELELTAERTTALLRMVDAVREMLRRIAETGDDDGVDTGALAAALARLGSDESEVPDVPWGTEAPEGSEEPQAARGTGATDTSGGGRSVAPAGGDGALGGPGIAMTGATDAPNEPPAGADRRGVTLEGAVRVDVRLLDQLMNLVGELVLARNQLLQCTSSRNDPILLETSQRLSVITSDLQEGVMRTRMQPIASLFAKVPRLVRDLTVTCGRQVRVEIDGEDTELDRTVLEAMRDPLTHLLRNAVDHGIEPPEVREAAGKSPEGLLRLRSYHESGQVVIELSDDGRGIDPAQVAASAVHKGIVSAAEVAELDERSIVGLIFRPGFSTAESVTNVSGRGVGMDVVKTDVERIGGTIEVQSTPGHGTTFTIKIPLTLAIIPALIVTCRDRRYAIAQVSLVELVALDGERQRVEHVAGRAVFRLRGELLPLVDLREVLGIGEDRIGEDRRDTDAAPGHVVVLQADGLQFGLLVESICDTEEIVVKPLGPHFVGLDVYLGATLMGDGTVAMILDASGVAAKCGLLAEAATSLGAATTRTTDAAANVPIVVCEVAGERVAVPLERIERLEEFDATTLELAGGRTVVQYRGGVMQLLRMDAALGLAGGGEPPGKVPVLVHQRGGRRVGLVVDDIVDIVDHPNPHPDDGPADGLIGAREATRDTGVVGGRVTSIVDPDQLVGSTLGAYDDAPVTV